MAGQEPIARAPARIAAGIGPGPILTLDGVALARGGRVLFEGLGLTLGPGEAALVTGPNGAGKSSLLRLAAGLLRADAGRVTAAGGRALLAEAAALDGEATLAAALVFWARMDDAPAPAARAADALAALALVPLGHVPVRLLSAGQRRRAAMARVVASRAALWLLDEPANGLDAESAARLEALIAVHRAGGGAAMVATHQSVAMPGAKLLHLDDLAPTSVHPELVAGLSFPPEKRTVLRQAQHERDRGR